MTEVVKNYYNGILYEEFTLINGKKEGLYQTWDENGKKDIECNYVAGIKNGLYKSFYYNGNIYSQMIYKDGLVNGFISNYYASGKVKLEYKTKHNKTNGSIIDGIIIEYKKDGTIKKYIYINGGKKVDLKILAKEQTAKYKEEMVAKVFHPDRLERFAKHYGLDAMDYMDCLE